MTEEYYEKLLESYRARIRFLNIKSRLAELRYNPYHDPKNGKFTYSKEKSETILTDEAESDTIEERANPYHDPKNGRFTFSGAKMSKFETKHVSSYIATNFPKLEPDSTHFKEIGDYFYVFEVKEFGTYNFNGKIKVCDKNQEFIEELRNFYDDGT